MLNRLYENNYVNETRTTHVQENRYNDNLNNQDSIEYLGGYNNIMYKINQKIEKLETNIKLTEDTFVVETPTPIYEIKKFSIKFIKRGYIKFNCFTR